MATMLSPTRTCHDLRSGIKRRADDALDDEQRFSKRFNLLNIVDSRPTSSLYIPIDTRRTSRGTPPPPSAPAHDSTAARSLGAVDGMAVDDTPDRVYIADLDAELASISSDGGGGLVFLPDIDERLSRLPRHVLRGRDGGSDDNQDRSGHEGKELVLYGMPDSLTAEKESDVVKWAMLETRTRNEGAMMAQLGRTGSGLATDGIAVRGSAAAVQGTAAGDGFGRFGCEGDAGLEEVDAMDIG